MLRLSYQMYDLFKISLFTLLDSPSIILKPEDKIVTEGKLLTFQCAAAGNPSPKITWTKDGITMAEGDTLSFRPNRTQSGKYWCSAENGVKSAVNASANLDVQCKYNNIIAIVTCGPILDLYLLTVLLFTFFMLCVLYLSSTKL